MRISSLQDKIFLRAQPGKIQEINLGTSLNIEHSIVGRNMTSRLDNSIPAPH